MIKLNKKVQNCTFSMKHTFIILKLIKNVKWRK